MKYNSMNLSHKREIALRDLITEPTLQAAAKVSGISEVTLWRWLKEADFAESYKSLKREAVEQAITRLQQISSSAVDTLRSIMENETNPPSVRVNAAKTIIEMAIKAVEIEEIERRIEDIEKAVLKETC